MSSDLLSDDTEETTLELLQALHETGEDVSQLILDYEPDLWSTAKLSVQGKVTTCAKWVEAPVRGDESEVFITLPFEMEAKWDQTRARLWILLVVRQLIERYRLPQTAETRAAHAAVEQFLRNPCEMTENALRTSRTACNSRRGGGGRPNGSLESKAHHLAWLLGRNSIWKATNSLWDVIRIWHLPKRDQFDQVIPEDQKLKRKLLAEVKEDAAKALWLCLLGDMEGLLTP